MNRFLLRIVFYLFIVLPGIGLSQSWNSTTICKPDFIRTTGESISLSPLLNDQSVSSLMLKNISFVEHGVAAINGNAISYSPEFGFEGIAKIIYTACDNNLNCGIGEASILVVNTSRSFYSDTIYQGVVRNSSFSFYLPEGDFKLISTLQAGSLKKMGMYHYEYTPAVSGAKKEILQFTKDAKKETIVLDILDAAQKNQNVNEDVVYLNKNTSKLFDVKLNDASGFLVSSFTRPAIGSISLNADNTFTFTSTLDFDGITVFEYTACKQGNCETSKVYLYVSDFLPREDLFPVFRTPAGKSLILPYEIPITNYEFKIISEPKFGMLDFYKGSTTINSSCDNIAVYNPLVYTPLPGFIGNDQFIVNFCLTNGTKQCAPLKIKVESYNETNCVPGSEYVWPGDANNDGIVNLKDINTISKFVGTTGPSRGNASSSWSNQISQDWNRTIHLNSKYADTDGNGVVDQADINLVHSNFNQSHKLLPQGIFQLLPGGLQISPVAAIISPGDDAVIQFDFGSETELLRDIESISFDLEFNNQIIKAEDLEVEIIDNSWFGYNNAILKGRVDGASKISVNFSSAQGYAKNGRGKTVKVKAKGGPIVTHVEGFKIPKELPLEFQIKNLHLGQSNGNVLGIADTKATVVVDYTRQSKLLSIKPFPNPSIQYFNLSSNVVDELIEKISIVDITGKLVITKNLIPVKNYKQEVSHLQQGVYFVQVKTNKKLYTEKLEVLR